MLVLAATGQILLNWYFTCSQYQHIVSGKFQCIVTFIDNVAPSNCKFVGKSLILNTYSI